MEYKWRQGATLPAFSHCLTRNRSITAFGESKIAMLFLHNLNLCIASPKSSSVGPPSSFSPWLQVTLPQGYKGADDLWLYHPLTRYTPDKRKRGVRQLREICRTPSLVA
jgi:hypothetical protein